MAMVKLKAPKLKKLKAEMVKSTSEYEYDDRPSISFKENELPEIKDWTVGKEYDVKIRVKMMDSGINEYGREEDKGKIRAGFRVVAVGVGE